LVLNLRKTLMRKLQIRCGRLIYDAEIDDSTTSSMLWDNLPIEGNAGIWGHEIFFPAGFTAEVEQYATEEVEEGTLAYWPPGKMLCIFFGPTPVSTSAKPRAYSPVNVLGRINGNLQALEEITDGQQIRLEFINPQP
jgi:hypothetical protein